MVLLDLVASAGGCFGTWHDKAFKKKIVICDPSYERGQCCKFDAAAHPVSMCGVGMTATGSMKDRLQLILQKDEGGWLVSVHSTLHRHHHLCATEE